LNSYDDFDKQVSSLLKKINLEMTEENYRIMYSKFILMEKLKDMDLLEKYSIIGKIGNSKTFLMDDNSTKGFKIENTKMSKLSLKANNCVLKGKWVYEILLLSNMETILGWV